MRVLVFGDSITQGCWDLNGGWEACLRRKYDAQKMAAINEDGVYLFNLGVSANTSGDLVDRFRSDCDTRIYGPEDAVVISIGVNDSRLVEGRPFSNTETYLANLQKIYAMAQEYTQKTLFVGLTPCDDARSNPPTWCDEGWTNERLRAFDATMRDFCKENDIAFVEIFEPFSGAMQDVELLPDALHPNEAGHKLIASLVEPELEKLLND